MHWQGRVTVTENRSLAQDVFSLTVCAPELVKTAQPGQFVHILVDGQYLRRPISICDAEGDSLRLVVGVRGEGTKKLCETPVGGTLDILGTLGRGFSIPANKTGVLLVGGGIGVPPMLYAAKQVRGNATAVLGFRDAASVMLGEDFKLAGCGVAITTEDGSAGEKGFVTAPLERLLHTGDYGLVLACGPTPMLKAVARLCEIKHVECQVSLEERMACGLGACLVCACKLQNPEGQPYFGHVCKDGPVFDAKAVCFT